jgi:hypothetical protein
VYRAGFADRERADSAARTGWNKSNADTCAGSSGKEEEKEKDCESCCRQEFFCAHWSEDQGREQESDEEERSEKACVQKGCKETRWGKNETMKGLRHRVKAA